MSAVRVCTPGNNPETRIYCEGGRFLIDSPCRTLHMTGYDAREARKIAKSFGWVRVGGKDYCAGCWPTAARRQTA